MFTEKYRSLLTARWAKVKTLTGKRQKFFIFAIRIRALNPRYAFAVITAIKKTVYERLYPFKTQPAIFSIILFTIFLREILEVLL